MSDALESPKDAITEARDARGAATVISTEMRSMDMLQSPPPTAAESAPSAEPAFVRFRDRVRARTGVAELLFFRIGAERFAFDIRAVDEVLDDVALQAVPEGPIALLGVTSYGAVALPVFEPAHFLGITHRIGGTVLVMRSGRRRIGLLVDDVDEVESVDLASIAPPPFDAGDEMLLGVVWREGELTAVVDARTLVGACHLSSTGSAA